ncbi:hypothetical protein LBMAG56_46760 [Verrucomicrobiota bacterium]|nr:hypothetical protein LBMAG56_46760 [Verrucomicrobiota bacterium]
MSGAAEKFERARQAWPRRAFSASLPISAVFCLAALPAGAAAKQNTAEIGRNAEGRGPSSDPARPDLCTVPNGGGGDGDFGTDSTNLHEE